MNSIFQMHLKGSTQVYQSTWKEIKLLGRMVPDSLSIEVGDLAEAKH